MNFIPEPTGLFLPMMWLTGPLLKPWALGYWKCEATWLIQTRIWPVLLLWSVLIRYVCMYVAVAVAVMCHMVGMWDGRDTGTCRWMTFCWSPSHLLGQTPIQMCVCVCVCVCACTHVCTYVCVCEHVCKYVYVCEHVCTYAYACICVCMRVCVHMCVVEHFTWMELYSDMYILAKYVTNNVRTLGWPDEAQGGWIWRQNLGWDQRLLLLWDISTEWTWDPRHVWGGPYVRTAWIWAQAPPLGVLRMPQCQLLPIKCSLVYVSTLSERNCALNAFHTYVCTYVCMHVCIYVHNAVRMWTREL